MPADFLRRRVRGLLRSRFSPSASLEEPSPEEEEVVTPSNECPSSSLLSQFHLTGLDGRRIEFPEVYCGKTGLDIPCIHLQDLEPEVFSTYTGPEGGLTQVGAYRNGPGVRIANLDDEMSLSMDGTDDESNSEDEYDDRTLPSRPLTKKAPSRSSGFLGSCSSLIGPSDESNRESIGKSAERFDWSKSDEKRSFGLSVSLYEKNPLTGVNAGEPIADVWGVVARSNNGVLALADGVNWGEGARLAARCAVRGAVEHMNQCVEDQGSLTTTTEVFHQLLASFNTAHSLILQEGGMLTTLCVALVAPARHSNSWVLCVCNVGDSLCFVYNRHSGVREVTTGSHDIDQMRDMRDAGGALGPVDGKNPQLHNLTCSMTFVEEDDLVFLTSDGVSDNFDPVVGRFCVIRKDCDNKENALNLPPKENRKLSVTTKESPTREFARTRSCAASLPCVDAQGRHELMLLRMRDIIAHGFDPPKERASSPRHEPLFPRVAAASLCSRLIQFATQLSTAKRRTLENPELYKREKMTKTEQRARRKMVREKISDMPGKLDHASVVCYMVGFKGERGINSPTFSGCYPDQSTNINGHALEDQERTVNSHCDNFVRQDQAFCSGHVVRNAHERVSLRINLWPRCDAGGRDNLRHDANNSDMKLPLASIMDPEMDKEKRAISPYEQLPVSHREEIDSGGGATRRRKHARGSAARHTLGVDVQWLKRLVGKKSAEPVAVVVEHENLESPTASERLSIKQRIRGLLGSNRQLDRLETTNREAPAAARDAPRPLLRTHTEGSAQAAFMTRAPAQRPSYGLPPPQLKPLIDRPPLPPAR